MEQVKFSNFDRLVNIHQSVELNRIKKINRLQLQEQVYQNAQLQNLNNQIATANEINRKILENQIKEIREKETRKFYKDLSFKMHVFLEPIESIANPLVRKYFINRYYEKIKTNITTADNYLEEINDRIFNKEILTRINILNEDCKIHEEQFHNSTFSKMDLLIEDLEVEKRKISNLEIPTFDEVTIKIKPAVSVLRTLGIVLFGGLSFIMLLSVFIMALQRDFSPIVGALVLLMFTLLPFLYILRKNIIWKRSYPKYVQNQQQLRQLEKEKVENAKSEYQQKLNRLNSDLQQHPSYIAYQKLVKDYPEFESAISTLSELEERYFPAKSKINIDPKILKKAAHFVVMFQQCSTTFLQRKLKLHDDIIHSLLYQLEVSGIVEPINYGESYKVLVTDETVLNLHLNKKNKS